MDDEEEGCLDGRVGIIGSGIGSGGKAVAGLKTERYDMQEAI